MPSLVVAAFKAVVLLLLAHEIGQLQAWMVVRDRWKINKLVVTFGKENSEYRGYSLTFEFSRLIVVKGACTIVYPRFKVQ